MRKAVVALVVVVLAAGCGGDDGAQDVAAFCEDAESIVGETGSAIEDALMAAFEGDDVEPAVRGITEISERFDDLAEQAPDEITDDVEAMAAAFSELVDQAQEAESFDDLEAIDSSALDSPELDAAGERLETWTDEHCPSE